MHPNGKEMVCSLEYAPPHLHKGDCLLVKLRALACSAG
jgi:hypothetical protein